MEEKKRNKKQNFISKIIDVKCQKTSQKCSSQIILSRKMRCIIFAILNFVFVLMSSDQGILSSTTTALSGYFEMSERELGGLGGMIFLGTAIGCIISFSLINKVNRKYLLLSSMCLDSLSLFLTTETKIISLLYFYRVIAGVTQSFLGIYIVVWSDQFGIYKYKSIWLSIINISSSLGYIIGYISGTFMEWESSFYLQNILIIINIIIIFIFLPELYFSMNLMPLKSKLNLKIDNENQKSKKVVDDIQKNATNLNDKENKYGLLIKEEKEKEENRKKLEDEISLFEDIQAKNEDLRKDSITSHLKVLIKSPIFILLNITLASMFIIVSGIQFWINDYLEFCLLIDDEKKRLYAIAFVVITSPTAGIILGGILSTRLGGYDTEKAIYIPLISSFLVSILAYITPSTSNIFVFIPLFWIHLFLGSVLLPVVNGIILVSVDKKYAGSASSICTLFYNIAGRLPGPNLYAFYKSKINNKNSRIPFLLLLNMAIPGFIAVLISVRFQKEKYKKIRDQINEEKELILDNENNNKKIQYNLDNKKIYDKIEEENKDINYIIN